MINNKKGKLTIYILHNFVIYQGDCRCKELAMPRRGRPRKNKSLFSVKDLVEYTSDSESDVYNIQHNAMYEVSTPQTPDRERSPLRRRHESHPRGQKHQLLEQPKRTHEPERAELPERMELLESTELVERAELLPERMELLDRVELQPERAELPESAELEGRIHHEQQLQQGPQLQNEFPEQQLHERHPIVEEQPEQQPPDEEDLTEEEDFLGEVDEDYDSILKKLKSKWLCTEINHCVSKSASEAFWKLGLHFFPELHCALGRRKKTCQFKTIRKHMYDNLLPPVQLEIGYQSKSTGEITVVNDSITPLKRFPKDQYEKVYEIGTVKVNYKTLFCPHILNLRNCQSNPFKLPELQNPSYIMHQH